MARCKIVDFGLSDYVSSKARVKNESSKKCNFELAMILVSDPIIRYNLGEL